MNERFFELKKSRQDQIINGAMRIFAENGYRHASTDDMVAAAGISKGLLFHYFKSKKGTWLFLYEYSTRYTLLEMREAQRMQGTDFFETYRQLVRTDAAVLRKYPWMPLFLRRADAEFDLVRADAGDLSDDLRMAVSSLRRQLLDQAARPLFLSAEDSDKIGQMLEYTRFGLMQELLPSETDPQKGTGRKKISGPGKGTAEGPDAGTAVRTASAPGTGTAGRTASAPGTGTAGRRASAPGSGLIPQTTKRPGGSPSPQKPEVPDSSPSNVSAPDPCDLYARKMNDYLWTLRKMNI